MKTLSARLREAIEKESRANSLGRYKRIERLALILPDCVEALEKYKSECENPAVDAIYKRQCRDCAQCNSRVHAGLS